MKISIILCIAAVTFFAFTITAQADTSVVEKGMPSENGFPSDYDCNITIPGKQNNETCLTSRHIDGTESYGKVIFTPHDQRNNSVGGEGSL